MSMQRAAAMSLMIVAMSSCSSAPGNMAARLGQNQGGGGLQLDRDGWIMGDAFGHRLIREEVLLVLFGLLLLLVRASWRDSNARRLSATTKSLVRRGFPARVG